MALPDILFPAVIFSSLIIVGVQLTVLWGALPTDLSYFTFPLQLVISGVGYWLRLYCPKKVVSTEVVLSRHGKYMDQTAIRDEILQTIARTEQSHGWAPGVPAYPPGQAPPTHGWEIPDGLHERWHFVFRILRDGEDRLIRETLASWLRKDSKVVNEYAHSWCLRKLFARRLGYVRPSKDEVCIICLDAFRSGETVATINCGHMYHVGCLAQWAEQSRRCSICSMKMDQLDDVKVEMVA